MAGVLTVGVAVADFVLYVDAFPVGAEKHRANDAAVVGGGCAANAAVAVARLGGQAYLSARMGHDPVAGLILSELLAEGVDCSGVLQHDGARSGFSAVLIDGKGERQVINFRGSGLIDRPAPPPSGIGAVLADTRWPGGAIPALEHARAAGIPGVVDAEAPVDGEILARASHVAFSAQGLRSLIGSGSLADALSGVAMGLNCWAAVTDGANGVFYTRGGEVVHEPAFQIDAVDTLGAGDVWHGAFALSLAEGAGEPRAVQFANAVAALKCARPGGRSGTPRRDEVEEFLKERGHGA